MSWITCGEGAEQILGYRPASCRFRCCFPFRNGFTYHLLTLRTSISLLRRSISERFTQTANSQSRVGAHGDRCKRVLASFQLWGRQREFYDDYLSAIGSASTLRADIVSGEASWLPSRAPLTAAAYEAE